MRRAFILFSVAVFCLAVGNEIFIRRGEPPAPKADTSRVTVSRDEARDWFNDAIARGVPLKVIIPHMTAIAENAKNDRKTRAFATGARGVAHLRAKNTEQAFKDAKASIALDDAIPSGYQTLAETHFACRQYRESAAAFEKAFARAETDEWKLAFDENRQWALYMAEAETLTGHHTAFTNGALSADDLIALCDAALPGAERSLFVKAHLLSLRCYAHVGNGDFLRAIADAETATALRPAFSVPYLALVHALREKGNLAGAIAICEKALALPDMQPKKPFTASLAELREQAKTNPPLERVTPEELLLTAEADPKTARKRFLGKRVIIRGKVAQKDASRGSFRIRLDASRQDAELLCAFPKETENSALAVLEGQTVEVEGKIAALYPRRIEAETCAVTSDRLDGDAEALLWNGFVAEKSASFRDRDRDERVYLAVCDRALRHQWRDGEKQAQILLARAELLGGEKAMADIDEAIQAAPDSPLGYLAKARRFSNDAESYALWMRKAIERTTDETEKASLQRKLNIALLDGKAIPAQALHHAFTQNVVAAEDTYKGREILVKGTVVSVTTQANAAIRVALSGPHNDDGVKVHCEFSPNQRAAVAKVAKGGRFYGMGTCVGMQSDIVRIRNCRVVFP